MTYNTDANLLRSYRESQSNQTGMACVHVYPEGSVAAGAGLIARFSTFADACKTLISAGFRKGDKRGEATVFYC